MEINFTNSNPMRAFIVDAICFGIVNKAVCNGENWQYVITYPGGTCTTVERDESFNSLISTMPYRNDAISFDDTLRALSWYVDFYEEDGVEIALKQFYYWGIKMVYLDESVPLVPIATFLQHVVDSKLNLEDDIILEADFFINSLNLKSNEI